MIIIFLFDCMCDAIALMKIVLQSDFEFYSLDFWYGITDTHYLVNHI